ncbi:selenocysteine synthase [Campylobacter blaseri]|uniref:L-seryl-tRNA(Sec) selenium transferase n=1 Tax=Campylobacter blaseri TaxID=2042961 RepID=A0A2P8R442_9BACT|nr:L-seryl-tRNA(Sec) selenium transferase [Campylobacter blaseri]PSM53258.1 L-seryl-tRNA(Sec) selenium transferase [Campylobacter blaseri]PSM54724.1 L-seryl-tRNA(Sec) selenium transferase [Campylobacter blaseri]QKF86793.1 selenocysteine synthase [Campylobacter blaseri]
MAKIDLPKIDKLVKAKEFEEFSYPIVLSLAKKVVENERQKAISNLTYKDEDEIIEEIVKQYKEYENLELKPLINATGVVIHTNLGRSVINPEILSRANKTICSYSNLEYNIKEGKRGNRYDYTGFLCSNLFNSEDAIITNNNASAVFLVLNTFAKDKEVVVSRGELVEIGGSFRVPEVMANSGAILKEVGTTNKTNINDYENAINEKTAMLMKVHQSNFSIEGFSENATIEDVSSLAKKSETLSYYDLGSGYLNELPYSLSKQEPPVDKILKSSVDLVSFSGDKLFGSVQCGIILGKKELIAKLRKNQLLRMLRVDKVTLSLLNETIKAYINKEFHLIQTQNQINKDLDELTDMANLVKSNIDSWCKVIQTKTFVGGGTLPCKSYPSIALAFKGNPQKLEFEFRQKGVIGRIENEKFLLDFRSIMDENLKDLIEICKEILE